MKNYEKVTRGISLRNDLWERIDRSKSIQMSRSTFIAVAVEKYLNEFYSIKDDNENSYMEAYSFVKSSLQNNIHV